MTTYTGAKPAGTPTWSELVAPDIDAARVLSCRLRLGLRHRRPRIWRLYHRAPGHAHDGRHVGASARRRGRGRLPGRCTSPPRTSRPMWRVP